MDSFNLITNPGYFWFPGNIYNSAINSNTNIKPLAPEQQTQVLLAIGAGVGIMFLFLAGCFVYECFKRKNK